MGTWTASCRTTRWWYGQRIALLLLLLFTASSAWGAEMVTNGIFNGSTGWVFGTATYDSTVTRTAGSGSAKVASTRNVTTTGTATQTVAIPAGATIDAVALYSQLTTSTEAAGDNITVSLRYSDTSTVTILSTGELANGTWGLRSSAPAVTLAMAVDQVIITMSSRGGSVAGSTSALWADELSISYTPPMNNTIAGAMSFFGATETQISVQVAFTGDQNDNNTCVIAYGTVPGTYPNTAPAPVKGAGLYTTTVSGLNANTTYYFRATFTDADGIASSPVTNSQATLAATSDPLLHNSINLGNAYWSGDNGWGVVGGKYGEFTCATCHNRNTNNVKRVVESIPATIGTAVIKPVSFRNITAFGNDAGGHTTSKRICEVCHTQTSVHKYNQTTGDLNHKNANLTDCTSCHAHNKSFGASCNSCHGYPPVNATLGVDGLASPATGVLASGAGAHNVHVNVRGMTCETCHQGYTANPMGNKDIEFGFNINQGTIPGFKGTFNAGTVALKTPFAPYSGTAKYAGTTVNMGAGNTNTCANVYCHGGYAGSNGSMVTPSWTAGPAAAACGTCHGAAQPTPPTSGNHVRHTGTAVGNMGIACSDCHGTLPADNGHVNGNVVTKLNPASKLRAGATYKGFANQSSAALSFGTCAVYCHSTVQTATASAVATPTVTPTWGGAIFSSCDTSVCHGNPPANANHLTHATAGYDCVVCHSAAGMDTAKHADYNIDVTFSGVAGSGTYSQAANTPGNGFGTCSATYCHNGAASAPAWNGAAMPLDCTGCHGNEVTAATKLTGAHNVHMNNISQGGNFRCSACHAPTITNSDNRTIGNNDLHVDGMVNYSGVMAGRNKTCSNFYCHSNGKNTFVNPPTWISGTAIGCDGCHGLNNGTGMPLAGVVNNSHIKHAPDSGDCYKCHFKTAGQTAGQLVAGTTDHLDRTLDARMTKPFAFTSFSGAYNSAARTCSATYCHGGLVTTPAWGTTSSTNCNSCHRSTPGVNSLQGAHAFHILSSAGNYNYTQAAVNTSTATGYNYTCAACHDGAVIANHLDGPKSATSDTTIFFGYSSPGRGQAATSSYTRTGTAFTDVKGFKWMAGGNGNCNTTYCHSNGRGGNGALTTINWASSATTACTSCHGNEANAATLSGTHDKHINNAAFGGNFKCADCHATTLTNIDNRTLANKAKHVNKFIDYSGVMAGRNKACNNIYCHSNGKGTYVNRTWTGAAIGCDGCHGAGNSTGMPPAGVATNSHPAHAPAADDCWKCHQKTASQVAGQLVAGSIDHLDRTRDARLAKVSTFTTYSGIYQANRTCTATYCHGGGVTTPAWGTANSTNCNTCHKSKPSGLQGGHAFHIMSTAGNYNFGAAAANTSTATGYNYTCASCHSAVMSNHADGPKSATSDTTIFFGYSSAGRGQAATSTYVPLATGSTDAQGFKWTNGGNGNCNVTYCHSNGRGGNGALATINWGSAATATCASCHGNEANASTLSGTHNAHIAFTATGGGFKCSDCHATTITNTDNRTLARKDRHVNKFTDYSGLYAGRNKACNNIYCHSNGKGTFVNRTWTGAAIDCSGCHGSTSVNLTTGNHAAHVAKGATCANCHWNTTQANGTITSVAQHINRIAGVNQGGTYGTVPLAVNFTGTTTCSNISCHSSGKFTSPAVAWGSGALNCEGCHPLANLSANHATHAGLLNMASQVTFYSYTANKSSGIEGATVKYGFGCANCHPTGPTAEATYHVNGSVEVQLDATSGGIYAGSLRKLNTTGTATYNSGTDRTCDLVYCHSDGRNTMVLGGNGHAPAWTTTFTAMGGDRCAKCHGNSPQTAAHDAHQVGLHYKDIFLGTSGKLPAAASGNSSHGVAGQSTTITCNTCHYKTMTVAANDQNVLCNTCHTKGINGALVKGNAKIAEFSFHVNGKKEVAFPTTPLKVISKAQLRETSFDNYSGLWTRTAYKTGAAAFDTAKTALSDSMYNAGTATCSNISCHNLRPGQTVVWTDTTITCKTCHTKL